jgi:hypothetical protein
MKKLCFKTTFWTMALVLLSLFNYACQDDTFEGSGRGEVVPGQPATVHLKVNVDGMGIRTRSIADDDEKSSYCQNLWIGIYNAEANEETKKHDLLESFYLTDDVAKIDEVQGDEYSLTLKTKSIGSAYIVAVANSDVNSGVTDVSQYGTEKESTLRQLLDKADTFEAFKSICALRPDANDVNVYANTLTMSGWYADSQPAVGDDIQPVTIQEGDNNFTGAIYLTRIISYNKFIIKPGENISLTLNTWKVCNIPAGCYLLEHTGSDNAGDNLSEGNTFFNESNKSRLFTAIKDENGTTTGHYFEFYQLENKHYVSGLNDYNQRMNSAPANASYVVVNATIDYYYVPKKDEDGNVTNATTAEAVSKDTEGAIHRTANVDYTIYLGYCEDKDDDNNSIYKAQDFNCRRNTKYTYKATVKGVNNVVIEAKKQDGDPEPGTDGWVSDAISDFEILDSHYCEFNICLTDDERNSLSYTISAPYGGVTYYYKRDKDGNVKDNCIDESLHTWIKFYPTKDKNTLAKYNGGKGLNTLEESGTKDSESKLWTLDNMCSPSVKASPYTPDEDGKLWYTVFVDEYAYHFGEKVVGTDEYDPSIEYYDETSWPNYVNQNDRMAELIMNVDVSDDKLSSYSYCKYAFSQKSIQTYYKGGVNFNGKETAIGVEHEEETYCMNMGWYFYQDDRYGGERPHAGSPYYDYANGRYNLFYNLEARQITEWSKLIQETTPDHVMAGSYEGCSHPDADYPVYMPGDKCGKDGSNSPTPDDPYAYYGNTICMNRNRDLNGNGIIDPNEVRWFLPTSSVYIQIGVAQSELPDPIMDFTEYDKNDFKAGYLIKKVYGVLNYHYITSDYQYYWAEQSVTTGDNVFSGWNAHDAWANTARCVRNLGTIPSVKPTKDEAEVGYAFTHDANTRTFTQSDFTEEALRGYSLGPIAPHDISSPSSRPYKKFEYASGLCKNLEDNYIKFDGNGTMSYKNAGNKYLQTLAWGNSIEANGICGQYSQEEDGSDLGTWRVPTACELALMWIEYIPQATSDEIGNNCTNFLCATHDYFISHDDDLSSWITTYGDGCQKYLGYNDDGDRKVMALDCVGKTTRLRCVRDVK